MGLSPDDPRLGRVAYAKLQGDGLEYFIRKYEVFLGRKSKSTELDIVLGASPVHSFSAAAESAFLYYLLLM